jgi:hypothetical protein
MANQGGRWPLLSEKQTRYYSICDWPLMTDCERLAADSAYGSAEMLGWLVNERAIEPHIPVFDKSARVGFNRSRRHASSFPLLAPKLNDPKTDIAGRTF